MFAKILIELLVKGGGPKTTPAVEKAMALTLLGKKVLIVDNDPQRTSATRYAGYDTEAVEEITPNLFHVYHKQVSIFDAIYETKFGFDILPSNSLLEATERALEQPEPDEVGTEDDDNLTLRRLLEPVKSSYDYIIIDTRPAKSGLTQNAILAADWVFMPITAGGPALDSLADTISFHQNKLLPKYPNLIARQELRIFIAKCYMGKNTHSPGIINAIKQTYGDRVLPFKVPESPVEFNRSFYQGEPLTYRLASHLGAKEYIKFAEWMIQQD